MVGFLVLAAIQIGAIILMRLISPKQKRAKAAPFEAPNVEEGAPIPVVFGMQQISGTVILVVDKNVLELDDGAVEYRAKMAYGMCWGPLDVFHDIIFDELALSLVLPSGAQSGTGPNPVTTVPFPMQLTGDDPVKFDITDYVLFGGSAEEGGINGEACIYRGTNDQPMDPLIQYGYTDWASRYPYMAYIRFGTDAALADSTTTPQKDNFYWSRNNPTPKPISFIVGRYPRALLDYATARGINGTYTDHKIGQGANPIEMYFEVMTNRVWGKSEQPSLFNISQLCEIAERLRVENRGLSATLADHQLDDFIDDVMLHIRAVPSENPETGLLEVKLLRPDYALDNLVQLTSKNTVNFRQGEGHFLETLNQIEVKYRKFDGGTPGSITTVVTAKFFRNLVDAHTGAVADWGVFNVQTDGRNLFNISVSRDRAGDFLGLDQTDHFRGSDYQVHTADGWFQFYANDSDGRLQDGDVLTIVYDSRPTFSGFVDSTATSQNLANLQVTKYTRSESYDYPMFIDEVSAQEMADFLRFMSSKRLATFEWDMTQEGAHVAAGDVVLANDPKFRLTNYPIRVTKVRLPAPGSPNVHFEGAQDIWGEQIALRSPSPVEGIPPELNLPPITDEKVTVTCLGGATRIGLTATDQVLNIEVIRADDADGTNAIIITPDAGIPGSTTFLDDPQTVGVTKCYRARAILPPYYTGGELSPVVCCTASATPPVDPSYIAPTWTITQVENPPNGDAELLLTDPQGRVRTIEVKSITEDGIESPYVVKATPYTGSVPLPVTGTSSVVFRITYVGADGADVVVEDSAVFEAFEDTPLPPVIGPGGSVVIIIPFHSTLTHGAVVDNSPAEWVAIGTHGLRRVDVGGCDQVRINAHVKTPLPVGAKLGAQYVSSFIEHPTADDWKWLTFGEGPTIPADAATDIPVVSVWADLALEARQEIVVRPVIMGGDGLTRFSVHEAFVEFKSTPFDPNDPGDPEPDPCLDTSIGFGGYEDQADLEAAWTFSSGDMGPAGASMALDKTGGEDGGRAVKFFVGACAGCMPGHNGATATHDFTGLTPGVVYTVTARVKIGSNFALGENFNGVVGQVSGTSAQPIITNTNWQDITFSDTPRFDSGTTIRLYMGFSAVAFFSVLHSETILFDSINVKTPSGEVVSPCSGGPTVPDDPGFPQPPGGGGPPLFPPPPLGPQKLYITGLMEDMWPTYNEFTGTLLIVTPSNFLPLLDAAQAAGLKLFCNIVGRSNAMSGGVFSQAAYLNTLSKLSAVAAAADAHPAMGGIRVLDEPNSVVHWNTVVPMSVVDGVLAKAVRNLFPTAPLHLRMRASLIAATGYHPQYIQISTCHYAKRLGPLGPWMASERSFADRLGLSIGWGFNPLSEGASPMSPSEMQTIGITMANDPNPFYHISVWAGVPTPYAEYLTPAYLTAFNAIANALNT